MKEKLEKFLKLKITKERLVPTICVMFGAVMIIVLILDIITRLLFRPVI